MNKDTPPFDPPDGLDPNETALHLHHRFHLPLLAGIGGFALLTFYASLVVAFQVIPILWPARQPDLGIDFGLPGVDTNKPEHATIEERINIVVLGLDQRRDEPDDSAYRTDSVMILTMDPFSKKGGAFSIPRDTWLDIPDGYGGYTTDRINVAYEMGEYTYKDYPGGGAGLVKDTIEYNFNIPIDYYVVLNFNNFIDLIDELGGVDIDVPEYAYDPSYDDCNECGSYPVEFIEGPEHMDGERALAYARIRASDNDFKRIERQQLVVRAAARKASDLGTVFTNALDLYRQYKNAVRTDISDLQIPGLADLAQQIGPDNIRTVSMAEATYSCGAACPGAVLLWDPAKVEALKARVFSADAFEEDGATVQILNGTEVPDLARYVESLIANRGITSDRVLIDELLDGPLYDRTLIVNLDGKQFTAEQLANWLDLPATRVVTPDDPEAAEFLNSSSDVVVVLGADVDLTGLESGNTSLQEPTNGGG